MQLLSFSDISQANIQQVLENYSLHHLDELYSQIGLGNLLSGVVAYRLLNLNLELDTDGNQLNNNVLKIKAGNNLLTNLANCCHPIPGDAIIACVSQTKELSIYYLNCHNVRKRVNQHQIKVQSHAS